MQPQVDMDSQYPAAEWRPAEQPLTLEDYLGIARRRAAFAIAASIVLALSAVYLVLLLPSVYRAQGTIAVETQQIPEDLVRSTVRGSADQRIGFIQQIVMTDSRLEEIIRRFDLYPEDMAKKPLSRVIGKLRSNIFIEAIRDPLSYQGTIAFTVSFDHTSPSVARDVTTTLVDLFLAENARTRRARAGETAEFLRRETAELDAQVRDLEQQIADFKQRNSEALPEHLNMRVNMLQQAEFGLRAVEREIAATEPEIRSLQTQRNTLLTRPTPSLDANSPGLTPAQRLQLLQAELQRVSAAYTQAHPDVKRVRRMLAEAKAEVTMLGREEMGDGPSLGPSSADPLLAQLDTQLTASEIRLASLRDQRSELEDRITELRAQILRTAQVEQGLRELSFKYDRAATEYDSVRVRRQEAELAESLESQHKAERFTLLEPPRLPVEPERPNRLLFGAAGVVAAFAGALILALALEFLDKRVHDRRSMIRVLGGPPIAVLPYIERRHEQNARRLAAMTVSLGFCAIVGIGILAAYHFASPLSGLVRHLYY